MPVEFEELYANSSRVGTGRGLPSCTGVLLGDADWPASLAFVGGATWIAHRGLHEGRFG